MKSHLLLFQKRCVHFCKLNSGEKTLLVGFPSNGLVGTFSISYLIHYLKMNKIDEIQINDVPPTVFVENGEILAPIRAYSKNNLFVIICGSLHKYTLICYNIS